jgi:hypothetical protein
MHHEAAVKRLNDGIATASTAHLPTLTAWMMHHGATNVTPYANWSWK